MDCVFCQLTEAEIIFENDKAYAFFDKSPVNPGHLLIIPKKHRETYFDLSDAEKLGIDDLLKKGKAYLDQHFQPEGYNIGANCGEIAGQTVFHCHVHLIPRYSGDVANPRGGVRGVIPERRIY